MKGALALVTCAVLVTAGMALPADDRPSPLDEKASLSPPGPAPAAMGDGEGVDDAAHFRYYQNESNIIHWYEWWYVNVKGEDGNNLLVEFFTFGDLNNPLASAVGIVLIHMKEDGTVFRSLKSYPGINYALDYEKCDVVIDGDYFRQDDTGTTYTITYTNAICGLELNLSVESCTRSVTQAPSAVYGNEWMSWNVAVPLGNATGTLSYHDLSGRHTYDLEGRGYHDHNWGIARKLPLEWDWGEFSDPRQGASITYGMVSLDDQPFVGGIYFANATTSVALYMPDLRIRYLQWERIAGVDKPVRLRLQGANQAMTVNLTITYLRHYVIASVVSKGMPYLMGTLRGTVTVQGHTYTLSGATGFYEHHFFNFLG